MYVSVFSSSMHIEQLFPLYCCFVWGDDYRQTGYFCGLSWLKSFSFSICRWETIGKTWKVAFSRITFKEINFEIMLRIHLSLGTENSDKTWLLSVPCNLVMPLHIRRRFCKLHCKNTPKFYVGFLVKWLIYALLSLLR